MANPSVALEPAVFCTVPEMQGFTIDPPTPISRIAAITTTASRVLAVKSLPIVGASTLPPNHTGYPIRT